MRTLMAILVFAFAVSAARAQDPGALASQQFVQQQILLNQQAMVQQTVQQAINAANDPPPVIRKPFQIRLRSRVKTNELTQAPAANHPVRALDSNPTSAPAAPSHASSVPYPYATNVVPYPYATNAAH